MEISKYYKKHPLNNSLINVLTNNENKKIYLQGLLSSSSAFIINNITNNIGKNIIISFSDYEEAAYFFTDLKSVSENSDNILFFPSSYKKVNLSDNLDQENIVIRTDVLNKLSENSKNYIIITDISAFAEKVIVKEELDDNTLKLNKGEIVNIDFINEVLYEYGFERTDFVYEPGQFAVRGGIVDIFSYSNDLPYRIEFNDATVETIRSFEVDSQLSKSFYDSINIVPDIKSTLTDKKHDLILSYLDLNSILIFKNLKYSFDVLTDIFNNDNNSSITKTLENKDYIISRIEKYKILEFGNYHYYNHDKVLTYNIKNQPIFQKNFELLSLNILENINKGYLTFIISENSNQFERLNSIFKEIDESIYFEPQSLSISEGFIDDDLKICCYTDHQIFERYHKYKVNKNFTRKETITFKELTGLQPGDYVVHIDHGIGVFGGLDTIEINGKHQETIRLVYKDKDILYVNVHSLHKISKYRAKDGEEPKINKLGTGAWQKLKQNTKSKIKDIAKELISLYAKRKQVNGFSFSTDSYLQKELEASFIYEDTPDQANATIAVKADMEKTIPMDRLVCGDVGFGKTEVAIRAAFKAVCDSKQVAVLVPTTILALQHFRTFSERLKGLPCNVDYVSRLRGNESQRITLKNLSEGKVDILIGTHKIIGKDVRFKDLGLLIIDEEQKFGVAVKDKLKQIKVNVDTLTLSATPIPRTLQFSMLGARDLSIINTPPPNRHPIVTELHTFNEQVIKDAILYEINRGGQVFFIHNRIQNINDIALMLRRLIPKINVAIAHGQMEGKQLEKIMLDFISGDYDVLVATSIIENGLDIPNANTIIINNANNFGLSDLHQLRGRVGRSNKKAFCYLLAPPLTMVTPEARRRLNAIEEYSDLGSGFNIALQDLDIRGAGNLLGAEQSGFISDIGYETYHKILDEAIRELKENQYSELYKDENVEDSEVEDKQYVYDCSFETDLEILLPSEYISNVSERIRLYRKLDDIKNETELSVFITEMEDRFGKPPLAVIDLTNVVKIRWTAIKLGIEKIVLKNKKLIFYFISNQDSDYYNSKIFKSILLFIQKNSLKCQMKEINNKLCLIYENIECIDNTLDILESIINFSEAK